MGRIVVFTSVTLDGVMQAPGRPDEDTRGGFQHGGWAVRYADAVTGGMAGQGSGGGILLGRRTYEDFYSFWPKQKDNPFTDILNNTPKFVASRTLKEPLPWSNSTLLRGDAVDAIRQLEPDLVVLGSGELVRALMARHLVNQYVLLIHPLVLGTGRRLFGEGTALSSFRLVDTKTSTTGVVIATYRPE